MAFLEDLTFYKYGMAPYGPILAVGWLDAAHPYKKGKVPLGCLSKLVHQIQHQPETIVNPFRGFHDNNLSADQDLKTYYQENFSDLLPQYPIGNGEFHFLYEGIYYAAPLMVYEYIVENGYSPPQVFIDAVMNGTPITHAKHWEKVQSKPYGQSNEKAQELVEIAKKLKKNGWVLKASEALEKSLIVAPDNPAALFLYANICLFELKKYEEGFKAAKTLQTLRPHHFSTYAFLGAGHFGLGQLEEAKKYFELVLKTFEHNGNKGLMEVLLHLGIIETEFGNIEKGRAYLERGKELFPESAYHLNVALKKNKKKANLNKLIGIFRKKR